MGGFDFGTRQAALPESFHAAQRGDVRSRCANVATCHGVTRSPDCPCYAEYAARYWLRLGSFPPKHADYEDLRAGAADPDIAGALGKYVASPQEARAQGWSSLVHGPSGSGKTALVTFLSKAVMKWEIVHEYSPSDTRAIYFTRQDYLHWCRKVDDFRREEGVIEYMNGALTGSIMTWDDVDPELACNNRFIADLKSRLDRQLITHVVLSQPPQAYVGSPLFHTLGVADDGAYVTASKFLGVGLTGRILTRSGW